MMASLPWGARGLLAGIGTGIVGQPLTWLLYSIIGPLAFNRARTLFEYIGGMIYISFGRLVLFGVFTVNATTLTAILVAYLQSDNKPARVRQAEIGNSISGAMRGNDMHDSALN